MRYACLWSPGWSTGAGPVPELAPALLEVVPRVVVEGRGVVWADLRGLPWERAMAALLAIAAEFSLDDVVYAGLAAVPIVAEVVVRGAVHGAADQVVLESAPPLYLVPSGKEREFLAPLPLFLLFAAAPPAPGRGARSNSDQRLLALLDGVGLRHCGDLAALDPASVEVRFGAEGGRLWRLARGEDTRLLFPPIPPERPHASLDFIDYVVTDPERLVFTINALLENLTRSLQRRGEHARRLRLTLSLADGGAWRRSLRPARPTASREVWLRLARRLLERATVPDAVAGVTLEVEAAEPAAVRQGDLFDHGFATAGAVEAALARLLEDQGEILVMPRQTGHPLPERRVVWEGVDPFAYPTEPSPAVGPVAGPADSPVVGPAAGPVVGPTTGPTAGPTAGPHLSLTLLPEPLPIDVEAGGGTGSEAPHHAPRRYRDRSGWQRIIMASGPDRISGGQWEEPYAREYFRCSTERGELVWLFRDARRGGWFLHGWWG